MEYFPDMNGVDGNRENWTGTRASAVINLNTGFPSTPFTSGNSTESRNSCIGFSSVYVCLGGSGLLSKFVCFLYCCVILFVVGPHHL